MSFYSELVFFADTEVSELDAASARRILIDCELLADPADEENETLALDIRSIFDDDAAQAANEEFFHPDSITYGNEAELFPEESDDEDDEGEPIYLAGHVFSIHGYGYFHPWSRADLADRVLSHPKIQRMMSLVKERARGRCSDPVRKNQAVVNLMVDNSGDWVWIGSENV
ncbi:hypothetical protein NZK35_11060 [Stieleria sp. ICT_E10.1]|uniref:hypothetical protein n=1 Tax=Stieleria sedimenti TaxID=2976331 RepID=UPI00217F3EE5|nr:hypothetical protein [Stieleria sedimenti]MCS7467182.1 hypothetical protein [Stieleria sedimenti]